MIRKLTPAAIIEIREAVRLREELRQRASRLSNAAPMHAVALRQRASRLSNAALAERYGVHIRTIDKAVTGDTWASVQ